MRAMAELVRRDDRTKPRVVLALVCTKCRRCSVWAATVLGSTVHVVKLCVHGHELPSYIVSICARIETSLCEPFSVTSAPRMYSLQLQSKAWRVKLAAAEQGCHERQDTWHVC